MQPLYVAATTEPTMILAGQPGRTPSMHNISQRALI